MPWLGTLTAVGVVLLAVLVWYFFRTRRQDMLADITLRRKQTSRLVTRAQYVEGLERIPVVLSVTEDTFYYENPDLNAMFELNRIDEVEYDDELAIGKSVPPGCRDLRLRCHGATFEFLLAESDVPAWTAALPPRTAGSTSGARAAV